jgi:hypothetical protein
MAQYQVATIKRPQNWQPETADDVPLEFAGPVSILSESDDLFEAVSRAITHNESDEARQQGRWAVVVEPSGNGRIWPAARLCTPITYKVTAIWWPDGWEPNSPLDVPNCVWQAQGPGSGEPLGYPEAEATVLGLNRQCMDHPGTTWHVIVAIENEAVSRMISYDPSGMETTVETRRMHVIQPEQGSHGSCAHCPAHEFECAKAEWSSQLQTISAHRSRVFGSTVES